MKIEISKETCNKILKWYDYVTEKIILYYDEYKFCGLCELSKYVPCECIVAYPKNKRPEVLNADEPLMKDCKKIMYDNVIQELFNKRLLETMFNNF